MAKVHDFGINTNQYILVKTIDFCANSEPECTRQYMRILAPHRRRNLPLQYSLERSLFKHSQTKIQYRSRKYP